MPGLPKISSGEGHRTNRNWIEPRTLLAKGFLLRGRVRTKACDALQRRQAVLASASSGSLHEDPHLGNKGKIGSRKKGFIEAAKTELEAMIARKR